MLKWFKKWYKKLLCLFTIGTTVGCSYAGDPWASTTFFTPPTYAELYVPQKVEMVPGGFR